MTYRVEIWLPRHEVSSGRYSRTDPGSLGAEKKPHQAFFICSVLLLRMQKDSAGGRRKSLEESPDFRDTKAKVRVCFVRINTIQAQFISIDVRPREIYASRRLTRSKLPEYFRREFPIRSKSANFLVTSGFFGQNLVAYNTIWIIIIPSPRVIATIWIKCPLPRFIPLITG
jgi:hypothetical protein